MEEFDELRRRYEATPRQLDDRLWTRLREGGTSTPRSAQQKGFPIWALLCIGLGAPAAGAVFFYLLRVNERSYWLLGAAGVVLLVAGVIGLASLRSSAAATVEIDGKTEEQLILEQGPLVLAHLVRADERLWQPGAPPGRALLLFSLDPSRRFDRTYLDRLVSEIQVLRGGTMPDMSLVDVWRMVNSDKAEGSVPIPAPMAGNNATFLAVLVLNPKWLDRGRLTSRSVLAIAHPKGRRLMQV